MICRKCNRIYDPSMEFVEDSDLLEALDYFIDMEVLCPDCIYEVRDDIERMTHDLI